MPEIPLYAQGLPPKAGGVPDMPLDREPRGRVNLSGVSSAARERGRIAAEAALANQTPLLPENMYSGLERGEQRLAAGVEHLGGVMGVLAIRQQEAQNYIDVSRADNAMQEAYAAHVASRQTMDPREWSADLQKRLQPLRGTLLGNETVSPAARERIAERFNHFATMREIETQAQVTGAVAQDARGVIEANVLRHIDASNLEGVKDELAKGVALHVIAPGQEAVEVVKADQQIRARRVDELEAEAKTVAADPNGQPGPVFQKIDAFVASGDLPPKRAELMKQGLAFGDQLKQTRNLAAVDPFGTRDGLTQTDKNGKYVVHPEWSPDQRAQHVDIADSVIADWDRRGTAFVNNSLAEGRFHNGSEIRETMKGKVSPAVLEVLAAKADGLVLNENAYADFVDHLNNVNVAADNDKTSPKYLLERTKLETYAATFPAAAEKNLKAMIAERYEAANQDVEEASKAGVKLINEMFQTGQFGANKVPILDPKTGLPLVTKTEKYVIPKEVGWIWKRPGTAEDAVKRPYLSPVTKDASQAEQTAAFEKYQEALATFQKSVRKQQITDPAAIIEEVNKATAQGRLKIYPSVTPSLTDPRAINPALNPLAPGGLPTNATPEQLRARNDELIRKYAPQSK